MAEFQSSWDAIQEGNSPEIPAVVVAEPAALKVPSNPNATAAIEDTQVADGATLVAP